MKINGIMQIYLMFLKITIEWSQSTMHIKSHNDSIIMKQDIEVAITLLDRIAEGQRKIILSIPIYISALILSSFAPVIGFAIGFVAITVAGVGLHSIHSGSEKNKIISWILISTLLIPGLGAYVIVLTNYWVNKLLKSAGYEIGILGAKKSNSKIESE